MKLNPIVAHLRATCPSFAQRISGGIDWDAVVESAKLALPAAYVIASADVATPSKAQNVTVQDITDQFNVVIVLDTTDERGQAANDLRAAMQQHAGVFRTQASMDEGVKKIAELRDRVASVTLQDKSKVFNTARIEALEVDNLIEVAQATMVSAAARKECRGAHTVYDYEHPADHPEFPLGRNDQEWMKHTLWYSEGNRLDYKPVNLKPLTVESIPPKVRTF